jgi:hypothetical protein
MWLEWLDDSDNLHPTWAVTTSLRYLLHWERLALGRTDILTAVACKQSQTPAQVVTRACRQQAIRK